MADNDLIRNKGIMSAAQTMWTIDFDSEQSLEIGKVQNQKFTGKCWIYAGLNLLRILANRKNSRTSIILSANCIAYYDKYEKSKYFFVVSFFRKHLTDQHERMLMIPKTWLDVSRDTFSHIFC